MTKEEAIKHLKMYVDNNCYTTQHQDACRMAIAALRDKKNTAMLDRSRWEGCKYCADGSPYSKLMYDYQVRSVDVGRYCKMCGRPLTEEAWEQLERRLK